MKELSDSFYCEIDLLQNVGLTNPDIQIQVLPELSGNKMAANWKLWSRWNVRRLQRRSL